MFSLHYVGDNNYVTGIADGVELYYIFDNRNKKFLSFPTIRINRFEKQIYFSNFDELSIDMRKDIYKIIKESKDILDIEGYRVSAFYSGYSTYKEIYNSIYI